MSDKPINPWIAHCKNYVKEHGCSYKEAIKLARPSYKPITNRIKKPATEPPVEEVEKVEQPPPTLSTAEEFKLLELPTEEVTGKLAKLSVKRPKKKKEIKKE
jgi:hypothetical protein